MTEASSDLEDQLVYLGNHGFLNIVSGPGTSAKKPLWQIRFELPAPGSPKAVIDEEGYDLQVVVAATYTRARAFDIAGASH